MIPLPGLGAEPQFPLPQKSSYNILLTLLIAILFYDFFNTANGAGSRGCR